MLLSLDVKDCKILSALDLHARATYSEIGKETRLSKQVVEYRINNLLSKNIIEGFVPIINAQQLGYLYCRLSVTLQNCDLAQKKKIIEELCANPKVFWMFEMQGHFDIFFGSWHKTIDDYKAYIAEFMEKYGLYVRHKTENIATDIYFFEQRYLLKKQQTQTIHMRASKNQVQLDDVDKKLLQEISINARCSLVELGQKIKQHPRVVSYRLRILEQNNIILGYRTIINFQKLGFTWYKVFINLNRYGKKEVSSVKEFIKNHPVTIYLVEGINLHADIDCEIVVQDNAELFDFITKLREHFPQVIGDYSTICYVKTHKTRFLPF